MKTSSASVAILILAAGSIISCSRSEAGQSGAASKVQRSSTGAVGGDSASKHLPSGFLVYNDPQGSGRLIYVKGPRASSAKATMRQFLASLRSYFDGPIHLTGATGNPEDTMVQAMLTAKSAGQSVAAVAAVVISTNGSTSGLIYDRPAALRSSYARLSNYFSKQMPQASTGAQKAATPGAAPDTSTWRRQTSGDRSTSVLLPPNWHLTDVANGSAGAAGPENEQVALGVTFPVMSQPPFPGARGTFVPYMSPEQALRWYTNQFGSKVVRVIDHAPGRNPMPGGQAEFITVEGVMKDGTPYKAQTLVMTTPMAMNNWMFYITYVAAPPARFDTDFATLVAIWQNWKLDPTFVQQKQADTARVQQQTRNIINETAQHTMHAYDNVNEAWDQVIRGVTTMENTDTGARGETQLGTAGAVLKECQRRGISCREVPTDELVQPQ